MDYTLIGLKNTYCFLDDILIVSKGSVEEHKHYLLNWLKRLFEENFTINLPTCHFSKLEIDWLGNHLQQPGVSPLESQTAAILSFEAPKALKNFNLFWVRYITLVKLFLTLQKLAINFFAI